MGAKGTAVLLAACAFIGVLVYVRGGGTGTPARRESPSPQHAMLEASRDKFEDPDLGALFDELNAQHFSGQLPDAKVLWDDELHRLDVGEYRQNGMTDGKIILLNAALRDDDAEVRRTLCHEMVHVKLLAAGNRSTAHEALFQTELRRIFDQGCFEAIWATPEERASLEQWINDERTRLDTVRIDVEAQGAAVKLESERVGRAIAELNQRIERANAAGAGWPSSEETEAAERQKAALNDNILGYNNAVAASERDLARFNEAVQRYNLMLAYPDGLAEDRAKGTAR